MKEVKEVVIFYVFYDLSYNSNLRKYSLFINGNPCRQFELFHLTVYMTGESGKLIKLFID